MGSATMLEVYGVIVPGLVIFFLYILPIPVLPSVMSRAIVAMESQSARGVTVLSLLAIITSFAFLAEFLTWQNKYDTKKTFFADISMKLQYEHGRLRVERNMYIHILACVLCLALKRFAFLTMAASGTALPKSAAARPASAAPPRVSTAAPASTASSASPSSPAAAAAKPKAD